MMGHQLELVESSGTARAYGGLALRPALGTRGRAAVELLDGEGVLGVYVDTAFSGLLLGALRGRRRGAAWALAWGRTGADGRAPAVAFEGGGPLRRRSLPVAVTGVGERFWMATAQGEFKTVTAAAPGRVESWRLGALGA
ncbi:hypothetical protein [Streptomyces sp. RPT161]|uniref:hypothetical protein n=1 Tax=Streptomyces sp. RPT161 TaxID=3015993 RepID=UPI0022B89102|nr:hypothetical protein [Streptomyces sp. RPT161]